MTFIIYFRFMPRLYLGLTYFGLIFLFYTPLKTSEYQRLFANFHGQRTETLASNGFSSNSVFMIMIFTCYPVDTQRKLNVHKTFRRHPGRCHGSGTAELYRNFSKILSRFAIPMPLIQILVCNSETIVLSPLKPLSMIQQTLAHTRIQ